MKTYSRTLTGTGDREHDLRRMPSSDTSDLAKTLVRLTRELLGAPTVGNTLETVTLGDSDDINDLVLLEDRGDLDGLLEKAVGEVDLVGNGATVDLNLHQVGLLLRETSLANLGVRKNTDDRAVLADTLELAGDGLAVVLCGLLGVTGEGLLLGTVPVLVEPTLDLVRQVRSPDSGKSAETTGSLDVANDTNDDQWRGLDDGNGLDDLTLVHFCKEVLCGSVMTGEKTTYWSQDGQGHERRGSCRPCSPWWPSSAPASWGHPVLTSMNVQQNNTTRLTLGKDLHFPRWRAARLRGRKPKEPWRGASN
jgi:hypothetical protein